MPLQPSDIEFRYSNNNPSLTAGNSDQSIPPTIDTLVNVCIGGWLSPSGFVLRLFDKQLQ